jgi:uncharacterized protein YggE
MPAFPTRLSAPLAALALAVFPVACSGASGMSDHPNSIQPETTLNISAEGRVDSEPDIAFITGGVREEAKTAKAAMSANAEAMQAMFNVLDNNQVDRKDVQTSNLSLQPRYDYVEERGENGRTTGKQVLVGYTASNQVTIKVRDLVGLGPLLDDLIDAGGNTFSGVRFALDDDTSVRNQARKSAMADALARAELYAEAADMKVHRIVTVSEGGNYNPAPQPMVMARMESSRADAATPIAGGEIGYTARVDVMFQLKKK